MIKSEPIDELADHKNNHLLFNLVSRSRITSSKEVSNEFCVIFSPQKAMIIEAETEQVLDNVKSSADTLKDMKLMRMHSMKYEKLEYMKINTTDLNEIDLLETLQDKIKKKI